MGYVRPQECDLEACAATDLAIDADRTIVEHDQALRDRQTKSVAAVAGSARCVNPEEPLEDPFMIPRRNTDAVIPDHEAAQFVGSPRLDPDFSFWLG